MSDAFYLSLVTRYLAVQLAYLAVFELFLADRSWNLSDAFYLSVVTCYLSVPEAVRNWNLSSEYYLSDRCNSRKKGVLL
ncbi:hypothetical protein [Metabacillus sp. FJAT-52054]|uniref:Uncharacterized protein n=1 Tax=Metabacillus sediminis TaxID=3117746 RepID=A0ABZ2NM05_9BACI